MEVNESLLQPGTLGTTMVMATKEVNGRKEVRASDKKKRASTFMGKVQQECRQQKAIGRMQSG